MRRALEATGIDKLELQAESPLLHAERIKVPVLLLHGEDDYTVRVGHSRAMARALAQHIVATSSWYLRAITGCGSRTCG